MLRKAAPLLLSILGVLLQTSPVPLQAFSLDRAQLVRTAVPVETGPLPPQPAVDLDGDGSLEAIYQDDGSAGILSGGGTAWQSPPSWTVLQAQITDLNRDGTPELALLVWRPFRPWPVDRWLPNGGRIASFHAADGQSCHLILVGWMPGGYREVWAGSAMADPVRAFAAADLDGEAGQELVTLEGSYAASRSSPGRSMKVWEWNGFGFTVVSEVEGTYSKMTLVKAGDGRILILVP